MKQNERLWRILIPILFLFTLAGLLYTVARITHEDDPEETAPATEDVAPPTDTSEGADGSGDTETEAPPEEVGAPYELIYVSNGDGTCKVSDIKVNPNYREAFTLTVPAVSPEGERVTAVKNPDGFGYVNVPRVLLPEDYEVLLYRLRTHYGKDDLTVRKFESYYMLRDADACSTENLKNDLLTAYPWAAVTDFYMLDEAIVRETAFPLLAGWIIEAAPDYMASDAEKKIGDLVTANGMTLTWSGEPLDPETIPDHAMYVERIMLEDGIKAVGENAFRSAHATSLTLPAGLTEIGDSAFSSCKYLTQVQWPAEGTLTRIGDYAFTGCSGITEVSLTGNGLTLGTEAFASSGLTRVTLGAGVVSVGKQAFYGCRDLEAAQIGRDVTEVGTHAFADTSGLQVTFDEGSGLTELTEATFFVHLYNTTLPVGITRIGHRSLYGGEVSYAGTVAEWEAIEKDEEWCCEPITIHCTDGDVTFAPQG